MKLELEGIEPWAVIVGLPLLLFLCGVLVLGLIAVKERHHPKKDTLSVSPAETTLKLHLELECPDANVALKVAPPAEAVEIPATINAIGAPAELRLRVRPEASEELLMQVKGVTVSEPLPIPKAEPVKKKP